MIFGFNTDIKHEDTVYHVQSEARENELTLQTQVFVRGRCIGKRAVSYSEKLSQGGFNDQNKEQMLRDQHRLVLDAIRDGKLDTVMDKRETPETLATIKELDRVAQRRFSPQRSHPSYAFSCHRGRCAGPRSSPDVSICAPRYGAVLHAGPNRRQRQRRDAR